MMALLNRNISHVYLAELMEPGTPNLHAEEIIHSIYGHSSQITVILRSEVIMHGY